MPRFLITDVNTSYNKGDAAIVMGILKTIRKFYPTSEISILTPTPVEDIKYYSVYGAKTYFQLFNYVNRRIPRILYKLLFLLKIILYLIWIKISFLPLSQHDKKIIDLYKNADLIISCSGGRLGGRKYSTIYDALIPMYFAKKLGKKIYICSQSIEPFTNNILKILTTFILNQVDLITVREPTSFELLKSINIKKPFYLTADLAFLADSESLDSGYKLLKDCGVPSNNKLRVGITVMNWIFPNTTELETKKGGYINAITSSIERIIEEMNAIIIFFPSVIFAPKEDERKLSQQIRDKIKKSLTSNVFVLTENYSPQQMKAMIGTMDMFIATRLHSGVFALSMNIPSLIIAYEQKTRGLMEMFGLQDYVIDINTITAEQIVFSTKKLLNSRNEVTQIIKEKLQIIKGQALLNGEFIKELLNKKDT